MRGLEERLRLALEGTETGFWEWHVETDVIEWSDNMGPMYGLPRGTQPGGYGDFLDRILHPDDRDEMARRVAAALEHGTPYEIDVRVVLPDKGLRWLRARARAVRTEGRTERITGLLSDVTERRAPRGRARVPRRRQPGPGVLAGPGRDAREGRAPRRPRAGRLVLGAARRPAPGRGRPRRPGEGALGARAAGALPARPATPRPALPP